MERFIVNLYSLRSITYSYSQAHSHKMALSARAEPTFRSFFYYFPLFTPIGPIELRYVLHFQCERRGKARKAHKISAFSTQ